MNFVGKHREASLVEYKQFGDAGVLVAVAIPRLTGGRSCAATPLHRRARSTVQLGQIT
jgi:hypothetical protein